LKRFYQVRWIYRFALILTVFGLLFILPAHAHAQIPDPGDWVDDLTQNVEFAIDGLWYNLLLLHAQIQWFLMRVFFIMGIIIDLVTDFIAEQAFAPLITQSNSQFGVAVSMSFTIAMFVLGLSYMIAHFIRFNVVEFKSAFTWYVLVALFFQLGPQLYLGMNSLRSDINSFFYASSLQSINNSGSPLAPLNSNLSNDGVPMLSPCDNFGWLSGQPSNQAGQGVDGLDIGMAYMLATSRDVLGNPPAAIGNCTTPNPGGYPSNLPFRWYFTDGYFDQTVSPPTWEFITDDERQRSLDMAAAAQYRLIGAWPLLWLGIFEKIVYLLVTFAQGLSFVSFGAAAIFAFFKRTEPIARSVVDLWIEIIITSVVIALGQSLVVSLALAAAATQNPLASIGVGLLCAVLMFILMLSGMKLVWNALTRIFGAIGQATGGAFIPPQQIATGAAISGVGTVAAVATGGGALALAGAAMAGMSASGIGGQAAGMAGGQLMMAGRMAGMSGARRMISAGSASNDNPRQPAQNTTGTPLTGSGQVVVSSGDVDPTATTSSYNGGAPSPAPNRTVEPPPSTTISGYPQEDLHPESVAGRRTSRIQARFTPLPDEPTELPITQSQARQVVAEDSHRDDAAAQARLTEDNTRDDTALRSTIDRDNARDESTSQAQLNADNIRDDAVLRDALNNANEGQPTQVDTSGLERAGRDLGAAANALKSTAQQQHMDRVMGQMDVTGARNVSAVVGDAIDMEREYRTQMNKPTLEGAGDTFGGRMAQSVGMQPVSGQNSVSDPARFNAVGDSALRLGLTGGQVIQVIEQQANSNDGRSVSPEMQEALVRQVRANTGTRQSEAQQQVTQFLNVTAAMPEDVRITGSISQDRVEQDKEES